MPVADPEPIPRGASEGVPLLDRNAEFCGSVHLTGAARIDGRVQGEVVSTGRVWIGASGRIQASVAAAELIVEGELRGEVRATRRVELRAGSRVLGDLRSPRVAVAEGAFFEGRCTTTARGERGPDPA